MQAANVRYLVLILVLLGGAGLYTVLSNQPRDTAPRWPGTDAVYAIAPWSSRTVDVTQGGTTDLVTRTFRSSSGATATFTLVANRGPKLYGPGAEVPVLGSGYLAEPASADVLGGATPGVGGLIATRGSERWLVMYAYGERRGLLGNGPAAWSLAVFDGILGNPNDYYKMYLIARADDAESAREVADLAHALFPRVAEWYAA
jgi:hypothetical protein